MMRKRMASWSTCAVVSIITLSSGISTANELTDSIETCRHEKDLNQRAAACALVISQTKDRRVLLRAQNTRGLALCDLDRCAEAVADFDNVLRLDPSIAGYFDNRARALRAAGRYDEAIRDSDTAIRMAPTYAFTFFGKALALDDEKRFDAALTVLDQAGAIDPTNSGVWEFRGKLLGEAGRFNQAYAAYNRALDLQPSRMNVYRTRAATEELDGKTDLALADLKQYPTIGPDAKDVEKQINRLTEFLANKKALAGVAVRPNFCNSERSDGARPKCDDIPTKTTDDVVFSLSTDANKLPYVGPRSLCRQIDIVENIIKTLDGLKDLKNTGIHVRDYENAYTVSVDVSAKAFSCRGTLRLSNDQALPGTFIVKDDPQGMHHWVWKNDAPNELVPSPASTPNAAANISKPSVVSSASSGTSPKGMEDISQIRNADQILFKKKYKGILFSAKMTVNTMLDEGSAIMVGFTADGIRVPFAPIECRIKDVDQIKLLYVGATFWVVGTMDDLMSDIFLDPCVISAADFSWTSISSLNEYTKSVQHRWVKYGSSRSQGSYLDLASAARSGEMVTVLDLEDWRPHVKVLNTHEELGSLVSLITYDCGKVPRSMILASVIYHGNMATGTIQLGASDAPQVPREGWHVMSARDLDGNLSVALSGHDLACR